MARPSSRLEKEMTIEHPYWFTLAIVALNVGFVWLGRFFERRRYLRHPTAGEIEALEMRLIHAQLQQKHAEKMLEIHDIYKKSLISLVNERKTN